MSTAEQPERVEVARPFPNEHAARVEDPGGFQAESFRRIALAPGIAAIIGRPRGERTTRTQAYRFDAEKFTAEQARAWLREHDVEAPVVPAEQSATARKSAVRIVKQSDEEQTVTYVVLEAGRPDTDDGFTRPPVVRRAALDFMADPVVTEGHGTPDEPATALPGYVALNWITDRELGELDGEPLDPPLAAGSWVQSFRFTSREAWEAAKRDGFTGASIEGFPAEGAGAVVVEGRDPPLPPAK